MVTRKKTIVTSIIGLFLFSIGVLLFVYSFTFKRSSIIFLNDDDSVIAVMPTAVGKSRSVETEFSSKKLEIPRGYEAQFTGWSVPGKLAKVFSVQMEKEQDLTVKATYKLVKSIYSISYSAMGAAYTTEENEKKVVKFDIDTADFDLPRPVHKNHLNGKNDCGYTFAGWDIRDTKEVEQLFKFEKSKYVSNLILIAKWHANDYKLIFDDETIESFGTGERLFGYNSQYGIEKLPVLSKSGYKFIGWFDNPDFTGNPITSIAKGTTGDISLYPKWEIRNYTIEYNLNGGSFAEGVEPITSFNVLTETFKLPVPVKEGYVFIGWDKVNTSDVEHETEVIKGTKINYKLIALYEEKQKD